MKLGSSVLAMAQDPLDPAKIVYSDNSGSAPHPLVETAVSWDNVTTVTPTIYLDAQPTGPGIKALNSVRVGKVSRFAWLQGGAITGGDILYDYADDGAGNRTPYGPLSCSNSRCVSPFKSDDVAPDPTKAGRLFATCTAAMSGAALNNVRHVVRIDGSQCDVVIDGQMLPNLSYPSNLAVAPGT
jgi:hypothetical protein